MKSPQPLEKALLSTISQSFPDIQAVYLFGSYGTTDEWPESDVDIALLLPPAQAKAAEWETFAGLQARLEKWLNKDVDLINLRRVNTVLQKEVVMADRRMSYIAVFFLMIPSGEAVKKLFSYL
jgi:predicted nucleotidyltransferase